MPRRYSESCGERGAQVSTRRRNARPKSPVVEVQQIQSRQAHFEAVRDLHGAFHVPRRPTRGALGQGLLQIVRGASPKVRINLDSHISRLDLLGKDAIVLEDEKQVTKFVEGILPWSIQNPVALVFDEYDAGRPDVMFVIQRILEVEGKLTLLDQNTVLSPHSGFRLFATTNTIGMGDASGLYHGTQQINQGQMDRWHILSTLNYLEPQHEFSIITQKLKSFKSKKSKEMLENMIKLCNLTRQGFINGDISNLMSPRTLLTWCENYQIFKDLQISFELSFLNKCDELEKPIIAEYFQRCFGEELNDFIDST